MLSEADIAYIRTNYRPLAEVCDEHGDRLETIEELIRARRLPAPSYVLPDGTGMVPADYFALVDEAGGVERLRAEFERRHREAGGPPGELDADWEGYIDGIYAVCLRSVSPESIVRKEQLVVSVGLLLEHPQPDDARWQERLAREVEELDALEREFSPDYDRRRFGRPPTRDALIVAARERYPDLFAVGSHGR
jgi:Family of unknown function (DUF6058)